MDDPKKLNGWTGKIFFLNIRIEFFCDSQSILRPNITIRKNASYCLPPIVFLTFELSFFTNFYIWARIQITE